MLALVDEVLRLPSRSAASTAVSLLYGRDRQPPLEILAHVNGGIHIRLAVLLATPVPLAMLLPERLRVSSAWRRSGQALRRARAVARARYRDLQAAFVASARGAAPEPAASLVRYTYGTGGRQWLWAEASSRMLHRVVALNRTVLDLLASIARGEVGVELRTTGEPLAVDTFDLSPDVLDLMAAALPPVAVPDWSRLATALGEGDAVLSGEESVIHYQSLLAEILGLTTDLEVSP